MNIGCLTVEIECVSKHLNVAVGLICETDMADWYNGVRTKNNMILITKNNKYIVTKKED